MPCSHTGRFNIVKNLSFHQTDLPSQCDLNNISALKQFRGERLNKWVETTKYPCEEK